jgi:hypothetical protein
MVLLQHFSSYDSGDYCSCVKSVKKLVFKNLVACPRIQQVSDTVKISTSGKLTPELLVLAIFLYFLVLILPLNFSSLVRNTKVIFGTLMLHIFSG